MCADDGQLREDKIDLENALEAESEAHVNRLARELGGAPRCEQRAPGAAGAHGGGTGGRDVAQRRRARASRASRVQGCYLMRCSARMQAESATRGGGRRLRACAPPERGLPRGAHHAPQPGELLAARLKSLVSDAAQLGLSVDSLIGLTSADRDPFAHPTHHRAPPTTDADDGSGGGAELRRTDPAPSIAGAPPRLAAALSLHFAFIADALAALPRLLACGLLPPPALLLQRVRRDARELRQRLDEHHQPAELCGRGCRRCGRQQRRSSCMG